MLGIIYLPPFILGVFGSPSLRAPPVLSFVEEFTSFSLVTVTLYSHGHASRSAIIRLEAPLEHSPGFVYIGASDTVKRQRSRLFVNPLFSRLKAHNCIWWRGPATKPFSLGNVPENCLSLNIYFSPFFFTLWTRLLEDPVDDCYHPEPHSLSSSTTTSQA